MRVYLEVEEINDDDLPEFIRADITDKTPAEIAKIRSAIKDIMKGKTYNFQRHFCGHDEGKACTSEKEI